MHDYTPTAGSGAHVAATSAASTPAASPAFFDPWPVQQSHSDDSGHLTLTAPRSSAATSAGAFSSQPSSDMAEVCCLTAVLVLPIILIMLALHQAAEQI